MKKVREALCNIGNLWTKHSEDIAYLGTNLEFIYDGYSLDINSELASCDQMTASICLSNVKVTDLRNIAKAFEALADEYES